MFSFIHSSSTTIVSNQQSAVSLFTTAVYLFFYPPTYLLCLSILYHQPNIAFNLSAISLLSYTLTFYSNTAVTDILILTRTAGSTTTHPLIGTRGRDRSSSSSLTIHLLHESVSHSQPVSQSVADYIISTNPSSGMYMI